MFVFHKYIIPLCNVTYSPRQIQRVRGDAGRGSTRQLACTLTTVTDAALRHSNVLYVCVYICT
jgi:hypothetical protein